MKTHITLPVKGDGDTKEVTLTGDMLTLEFQFAGGIKFSMNLPKLAAAMEAIQHTSKATYRHGNAT